MGLAIGLAIASVLIRRFADRTPESLVGMTGLLFVGMVPGADAKPVKDHPDAGETRRLLHHGVARNVTRLTKPQHRLVVVCSAAETPHSALTTLGLATSPNVGSGCSLVDASFVAVRTQVVLVDSAPVPSPAPVPTCVEDAKAVLLVVDQYETKSDQSSAAVSASRR